jgi:hypothetical protein
MKTTKTPKRDPRDDAREALVNQSRQLAHDEIRRAFVNVNQAIADARRNMALIYLSLLAQKANQPEMVTSVDVSGAELAERFRALADLALVAFPPADLTQ